jgi:hypothetical protein
MTATMAREPMVSDELEAIISALWRKYPDHSCLEVEAVVAQVYAELAANAKVTAHLIPLTLNRSRRLLAQRALNTAVVAEAKRSHREEGLSAAPAGTISS